MPLSSSKVRWAIETHELTNYELLLTNSFPLTTELVPRYFVLLTTY